MDSTSLYGAGTSSACSGGGAVLDVGEILVAIARDRFKATLVDINAAVVGTVDN